MKKKIVSLVCFSFIMVLLLSLCACGSAPTDLDYSGGESDVVSGDIVTPTTDRKIIYDVDLYLYVKKPDETAATMKSKAEELGGYLERSEESSYSEDSVYNTYVFRIPTEKLNAFLSTIEGKGTVRSKDVSSVDVTTQYHETVSRIESLRAEKAALTALLEDTSDKSYDDVVVIRKRLAEIDADIAANEKEKAVLDSLVNYSRVTINVRKETPVEEKVSFGQQLSDLLKGSFRSVGTVAKGILIVLVAIFPYALLAAVIVAIVIGIRALVRKKKGLPPFRSVRRQRRGNTGNNFDPQTGRPLALDRQRKEVAESGSDQSLPEEAKTDESDSEEEDGQGDKT